MSDNEKSLREASAVRKIHDFYDMKPDAQIYQREFGFYVLDKWIKQGYLRPYNEINDYQSYLNDIFGYDEPAIHMLNGLGSCEGEFFPKFEEIVLEDRGDHELVRDPVGRSVLYFKGQRSGFMPEFVDHPVKDMKSWEEEIKWRMDPDVEGREELSRSSLEKAAEAEKKGFIISQDCVGGYMFLRSLMGPGDLLYQFYDNPGLIHSCMESWFNLADSVTAKHQEKVTLDELFLEEDICYKSGLLISPDMVREFLFPYYKQLFQNVKARNRDKSRVLHFQLDTDGWCGEAIDLYREVGVDYFSPFEVASGCDVVKMGTDFPEIRMSGGIDKRILAKSKEAIDRHIDYIMPPMQRRGGYCPTCDHGVPEEVPFELYMHFRAKIKEYA